MQRRSFLKGLACAGAALPLLRCETLFGAECAQGTLVSFGMVTDLHYADIPVGACLPPVGDRYYRESCRKLQEAVDVMNRVKPDFFIELGDFKDLTGGRKETLACLDAIERTFAGFKGDRFHVLGNHDFDCLTLDDYLTHVQNAGQPRALPNYAFVRKGVTFIVLDACYDSQMRHYSCNNPWDDANVPPEELAWLEGELSRAKGPVVVFCHQRIDPNAWPQHEVKNSAAVRDVLEKSGKVKAVFTGHEHFGGVYFNKGIAYYSLRALVVGTGEEENSYAVASLGVDGTVCVKGWRKAETARWPGKGKS